MAGGFFPPRRAVPVEGGYRLSGRCTFNSNCHAATWILGLAHVYDDGVERLDENGAPVTLITLFPREKAEIIDNWDTLGMRGTGSHDVNVDDLFVPAERAVPFKPLEQPSPAYSGPWHRLTIWPSVAGTAIPALGIAQAAIDEFAELATKKTPSYTTTMLKDRSIVQLRFATGGREGRIRTSLSARGLRRRLARRPGRAVPRSGRQGPPAARVEPRADRGGRGRRPDSLARRYGRYSERPGVPAPFSRRPRHYPARVCLREPHGSGRPGPLRSRSELAVPAFLGSSRLRRALIEQWAFAARPTARRQHGAERRGARDFYDTMTIFRCPITYRVQ